jgi:outer membrane protein OmpA-like peptidoglycan-associated protein
MSTTDSASSFTTTTTSTQTSWERARKNGGWLPVAVGAAGLAVLGLVNGLPMRDSVEKDLKARSQQALAGLGGGLTVNFTGRDGVVTGTLPAGVTKDQVLQAVGDVDGVRVVTFSPEGAAPSSSPSALPTESPSPAVSASATAAAALPSVKAETKNGSVVLTGTVPSQTAADALVKAAAAVYGADRVTNQLTVDTGVGDAGLSGFAALFGALGKDSAATASLSDGTLTLTGSVAGTDVQKAVEAAAAGVTGDAAKVVDQLTVSAPAPSPSPSPAATSGNAAVQSQLNALPLVLFPSASNSLTPQAQAVIRQAAEILKANATVRVRLDGHTDDLGTSRVNDELSAARAMTVRAYLVQLGVAADRLTFSYHGYADPKVANRDDTSRAQNRRVTFTVI